MVDIASSGEAAVHAAASQPYDLIFIDMPAADLADTARRIRALDGPAAQLPIVALTARPGEAESTWPAAGMNGVLAKPVATGELLDALATHVWRRPADLPLTPDLSEIEMV